MVVSVNLDTKSDTALSELAKEHGVSKSEMVRQMITKMEELKEDYRERKMKRMEHVLESLILSISDVKMGQKALFQAVVSIHEREIREIVEKAGKEGRDDALIRYILREGV
ncbi:MAG: ribbon-helix-helix protein, CopG family [Campylobacterales bacterium]|nr:ribbon-helix-helix protein, CopG family [Campylobacterales bacterium]